MEVDCKNLALEFSNRYLNLLDQKRTIDLDIKELKQEYDEQGLATKVVVKAINSLKKEKKVLIIPLAGTFLLAGKKAMLRRPFKKQRNLEKKAKK